MNIRIPALLLLGLLVVSLPAESAEFQKPFKAPRVQREDVFQFTENPRVKFLGNDKYEIIFAVKGYCDVTACIIDPNGVVVRHLGAGVLGSNAPEPFQKNSKKQTIYWYGKNDLGEYVKDPNQLRVQIRLGLKPEFDKLLGAQSRKAMPGYVWGIAADESGMYVFPRSGRGRVGHIRRYDRDGNYVKTVFPPAAGTRKEKLGGMVGIEYEKDKFGLFGPETIPSFHWGGFMPAGAQGEFVEKCQPVVIGERVYFFGAGKTGRNVYWFFKDGGTEAAGMKGIKLGNGYLKQAYIYMAASPDKNSIYISGVPTAKGGKGGGDATAILKVDIQGKGNVKLFAGHESKVGSQNGMFNGLSSLACDPKGNLYAVDAVNNRVQIFSPAGKHLKNIQIKKPQLIQIHKKTGDIYISQSFTGRKGAPKVSLVKFKPYPDLTQTNKWEGFTFNGMVLDSWSENPRFWVSRHFLRFQYGFRLDVPYSVRILEENGGKLNTIVDFKKDIEKESAGKFQLPIIAGGAQHVVCDPVREQAYVYRRFKFDLKTGKYIGKIQEVEHGGHVIRMRRTEVNDMVFDKYGFMHVEIPDGLSAPLPAGLGRLDPTRTEKITRNNDTYNVLVEVPYDYGANEKMWKGAVKLYKTGHHSFSWGFGVNMRGDMAVVRDIEYAPKMTDGDFDRIVKGAKERAMITGRKGKIGDAYTEARRALQERQKRGEQFYLPKRMPGVDFMGAHIFTFDRHGEVLHEGGVGAGFHAVGLDIDEEQMLYFGHQNIAQVDGKHFLSGRGQVFGEKRTYTPTTGVWVKTKPSNASFLYEDSTTPLDPKPSRAPDMFKARLGASDTKIWAEGVDWIYAGYSPFPIASCHCPQLRTHLDWYKRSFVPEAYRHSIGVLDTNGNLIMHFGKYGNLDSGNGPNSQVPVEGGISSTLIRFISGTDNYLVYCDWGKKVVVLKLNYHAEETAKVSAK